MKIKNTELLEIKKQIQKETLEAKRKPRFFALDLETESWDLAKQDLAKLEAVFGVLLPFTSDFKIGVPQTFFACEMYKICHGLIDRSYNSIAYVYVHNLDFDFLFLLTDFLKQPEKYRVTPLIVGSRIISVKIMFSVKNKTERVWLTKVEFRNSLCLMNKSLKSIGKELGLEKLESSYKFDPNNITEQDIQYCVRDCEIVVKLLENWFQAIQSLGINESLERLTLTASSCAFRVFKAKNNILNDEGKEINPWNLDSKEMNKEFRNHYFGGRTEVFDFNLAEHVSYWDINSLYPFVMITTKIPKPPYVKTNRFDSDSVFAYIAIVDESNSQIPLIPERMEQGKVIFSAKKKECLLFTEEYEYLRSQNVSIELLGCWECSGFDYPFKYIEDLYKLRKEFEKENKKGFAGAMKVIMNSTYGRFALITEKDETKLETFKAENAKEYTDLIGNNVGVIKNNVEVITDLNVVIASKITAMARLLITSKAREILKQGKRIYYMDTDSIVADSDCMVSDNKTLGAFKSEFDYIYFQAISAKDYIGLNDKHEFVFKTKGVKLANPKEWFDYHLDSLLVCRPIKFKELIHLNVLGKLNELEPVQRIVRKQYETAYNKRKINEDLTTSPITKEDSLDSVEQANAVKIIDIIKKLKQKVEKNGSND